MTIKHLDPNSHGQWIGRRWSVESTTHDGTEYVVATDAAGNFGCSCPAWKFQRKRLREKYGDDWQCKHIAAVVESLTFPGGMRGNVPQFNRENTEHVERTNS